MFVPLLRDEIRMLLGSTAGANKLDRSLTEGKDISKWVLRCVLRIISIMTTKPLILLYFQASRIIRVFADFTSRVVVKTSSTSSDLFMQIKGSVLPGRY